MNRAILAFLATLAMMLFGAEAAMQTKAYQQSKKAIASYYTPTVADELYRLRQAGADVYPFSSGHHLVDRVEAVKALQFDGKQIFPLSWISNATLIGRNEEGGFSQQHTDEMGFRNPPGTWAQKLDVAIIGASLCRSVGEDSETIQTYMRALGYPSINTCVGGTGIVYSLGIFREFLAARHPQLTLLMINPDLDLRELEKELAQPILSRYLAAGFSQNLESRQAEISQRIRDILDALLPDEIVKAKERRDVADRLSRPSITQAFIDGLLLRRLRHKAGLALRGDADTAAAPQPAEKPRADVDKYAPLVERLRDETASARSKLVLVFLPMRGEISEGPLPRNLQALEVYRRLGIPIIDTTSALKSAARQEESLFTQEESAPHYSQLAHRTIANAVASELEKMGIKSQNK